MLASNFNPNKKIKNGITKDAIPNALKIRVCEIHAPNLPFQLATCSVLDSKIKSKKPFPIILFWSICQVKR